jgi:hypothetical protein
LSSPQNKNAVILKFRYSDSDALYFSPACAQHRAKSTSIFQFLGLAVITVLFVFVFVLFPAPR